jgi:cobalamin synthase
LTAYDAAKMPSLIRFLVVVGLLVGLVYGAIFALANFIEPTSREMTVTIPRDVLNKPR